MTAKSPSGKGIHQDLDQLALDMATAPNPAPPDQTISAEDLEALVFL